MIKNEQAPDCCKNRLPPDTCFYSNIDPLDLHCCNNRSLGATCFYSNPEPTKNVNKLRTERARRIHNAVKTGLRCFRVHGQWTSARARYLHGVALVLLSSDLSCAPTETKTSARKRLSRQRFWILPLLSLAESKLQYWLKAAQARAAAAAAAAQLYFLEITRF